MFSIFWGKIENKFLISFALLHALNGQVSQKNNKIHKRYSKVFNNNLSGMFVKLYHNFFVCAIQSIQTCMGLDGGCVVISCSLQSLFSKFFKSIYISF